MSVEINFVGPDGRRRTHMANDGETLLKAAQDAGFDLEGACGGAMACATCHVVIDPAWYGRLPPPKTDETDMLDLAMGRSATSRLSCQIVLSAALNGLAVRVL